MCDSTSVSLLKYTKSLDKKCVGSDCIVIVRVSLPGSNLYPKHVVLVINDTLMGVLTAI